MSTVTETRKQIDAYLSGELGGQRVNGHESRNYYFQTPSGRLVVETHVVGKVTTDICLERGLCRAIPRDGFEREWFEENLWPAAERWLEHSGHRRVCIPAGGMGCQIGVLTSEAVDVLRLWVPMELSWQADPATESVDS